MRYDIQAALSFKTTTCITCGVTISLPTDMYDHRVRSQTDYYCPNGHSQRFIGETEEAKLRRQLELANRKLTFEESARKVAEQKLTKATAATIRLKRRIGRGVCPCCQRTVSQLARHMTTKHPGYGAPPGDSGE